MTPVTTLFSALFCNVKACAVKTVGEFSLIKPFAAGRFEIEERIGKEKIVVNKTFEIICADFQALGYFGCEHFEFGFENPRSLTQQLIDVSGGSTFSPIFSGLGFVIH